MNLKEQYVVSQRALNNAIEVILGAVVTYFLNNKKVLIGLLIFELWVHSLMFEHLTELKNLWELLPFVK